MDHRQAVRIQAVERYLLNELSTEERDAFEEHFFGCAECAEELRLSAIVVDNMSANFAEQPRRASITPLRAARPAWAPPMWAMAAMLALCAVIAAQNIFVIPQLKQRAASNVPRALPTLSLAADLARGQASGQDLAVKVRADEPLGIYVDIPPEPRYASYSLQVVNARGAAVFSVQISAEQAAETVQIYVPAGILKAERYELVVRGNREPMATTPNTDEVERHGFVVNN